MTIKSHLSLFFCLIFCGTHMSIADEVGKAKLVHMNETDRISALEWKSEDLTMDAKAFGDGIVTLVILEGEYNRSDWTLIYDKKKMVPVVNGEFHLEIPMKDRAIELDFLAIGPLGEIEKENIGIYFKEIKTFTQKAEGRPPKTNFFQFGMNNSVISYDETGVDSYSSVSLTGKSSYSYLIFPPDWDFGTSLYYTLLPITKTGNNAVRFLGVNLRFGYVVPFVTEPWRLSVLGGMYYTTMFVTNDRFGFKNLAGPQLFPALKRTFRGGKAIVSYLKFSPISNGLSLLSLSNRELALGGAYLYPLKNGHSIAFTLDVAIFYFKIRQVEIQSSSISLGLSYGL